MNMKRIFNILAVAAVLVTGTVSCVKVQQEDAFSKAPVAPELNAHNDVLITTNTMDEAVTFTWSAYRNLPEGLSYTLYATYTDEAVALVTTQNLYYTCTKSEFKALLYQKLSGLPQNDAFSVLLSVAVTDGDKFYKSSNIRVSIYAAGDAVAPVVEEVMTDTVLDVTDPEGQVEIMSWEPARLVYGETVTYDVYVSIAPVTTKTDPGEEPAAKKVKLNEDPIEATSFSTTVDKLNEAIIAAGGVEGAANDVVFDVLAKCESLPNGVEAASAVVNVTTYLATFAEQLYLPGSYQGWDPATAPTISHSKVQKGFYQGIIDLTTTDGSDAQFKFCPVPKWEGDFGGAVEVTENASGDFPVAVGTVGVSDNIVVPSGVYYIELNKKLSTLTMVKFETLSLIGSAVGDYGWGQDVDLAYDAKTQAFTAVGEFKPGEFKMRFNHDWNYSLGGNDEVGYTLSGGNIKAEKDGEYKIVVDASVVPFVIKYINTSFPDNLYVPGSHNGWDHSKTVFAGNGEGLYEGFANLGGEWGFKFTPAPDWDHGEWGFLTASTVETKDNGDLVVQLTSDNASNILEGGQTTYYKAVVNLTDLTATLTPVTTVGIIGGFSDNNWVSDKYPMTYNAEKDCWTVTEAELIKKGEWKFRMNGGWDVNLGGAFDNLTQDGSNLTVEESGIYTVELFISTTPYKAVLTKTGESGQPEWADDITIAGDYSGHEWKADKDLHLNGKGGGIFKGAATMFNAQYGFKVVHQGQWIGHSAVEGTTYTLLAGDAGQNMTIANGSYYWVVDLSKNTATATKIETVGLIGNFAASGWATDVVMTFDEAALTYSADVTFAAGDEFKVRFNGSWDTNLGGSIEKLLDDASNIAVAEAGTYKVVLDMKTGPWPFITLIPAN